jgi:hypothetical protein
VVVAVDLDQTALTTVVGRMETAADKKSADIVVLGGARAEWFARKNSKARDGLVHISSTPPIATRLGVGLEPVGQLNQER